MGLLPNNQPQTLENKISRVVIFYRIRNVVPNLIDNMAWGILTLHGAKLTLEDVLIPRGDHP